MDQITVITYWMPCLCFEKGTTTLFPPNISLKHFSPKAHKQWKITFSYGLPQNNLQDLIPSLWPLLVCAVGSLSSIQIKNFIRILDSPHTWSYTYSLSRLFISHLFIMWTPSFCLKLLQQFYN